MGVGLLAGMTAFFATERELRDLTTGKVIGVNGGPAEILTPAPPDGPSFEAYDEAKARPVVAIKTSDDGLLETYIRQWRGPAASAT